MELLPVVTVAMKRPTAGVFRAQEEARSKAAPVQAASNWADWAEAVGRGIGGVLTRAALQPVVENQQSMSTRCWRRALLEAEPMGRMLSPVEDPEQTEHRRPSPRVLEQRQTQQSRLLRGSGPVLQELAQILHHQYNSLSAFDPPFRDAEHQSKARPTLADCATVYDAKVGAQPV